MQEGRLAKPKCVQQAVPGIRVCLVMNMGVVVKVMLVEVRDSILTMEEGVQAL
jgi:hypothetical protein